MKHFSFILSVLAFFWKVERFYGLMDRSILHSMKINLFRSSGSIVANNYDYFPQMLHQETSLNLFPLPQSSNQSPESDSSSKIRHGEEMLTPDKMWDLVEKKGIAIIRTSSSLLFPKALITGALIGIGGIFMASVGYDMGVDPYAPGNGLARLACGAFGFPVPNFILSTLGIGTWTGDVFATVLALFNGKVTISEVLRIASVKYIASFLGATLMALIATGAGIPALGPIVKVAYGKTSKTFQQLVLRGLLGSFLLCLSSYMIKASNTITARLLGIWFPVSTYVICGFEHCLSTYFFLICGIFNGAKISTAATSKVILATTIGNVLGAILFALIGHFKIGITLKREY